MTPRSQHPETGSVAVETAIVAPAFVFLLLLVVFAGRVSHAEATVVRSSSEAARAASLEHDPAAARTAAIDVATENLSAADVSCDPLSIDVDTSNLRPGGDVRVTVRCVADMSDVTLVGVPGTRTFEATSIEVVDRFRAGDPG